ncbi:MAG TPA: hypothetical protein VNF49_14155 [Candidatus Binataceae bacterium]|nr:hypothetical protein [Candidatus Binataceae bacterium]
MKEADGADLVVVVVAMADRDRQRSKAKNQTGARPRGAAAASSRLFPAAASAALPRASQPPANGARAFSPYAALIRDEQQNVVGTTWGATTCLFPRQSAKWVAISDDGRAERTLRCGFCTGCAMYDRQALAKRLAAHYAECADPLWVMIVEVAPEIAPAGDTKNLSLALSLDKERETDDDTRSDAELERARAAAVDISARLHRARSVAIEPGFYRLAGDAIAFLVRATKPRPRRVRALRGLRVRVEQVRRSRGLRAWAPLTAGMLRSRRAEYGEWTNRYYHRGLPPPARERGPWIVSFKRGLAKRHAGIGAGARAWRADGAGGVTTYLPAKLADLRMYSRSKAKDALADLLDQVSRAMGCGPSRGHDSGNSALSRAARERRSDLPGVAARAAPHDPTRSDSLESGRGNQGSLQFRAARPGETLRAYLDDVLKRALPRGDP